MSEFDLKKYLNVQTEEKQPPSIVDYSGEEKKPEPEKNNSDFDPDLIEKQPPSILSSENSESAPESEKVDVKLGTSTFIGTIDGLQHIVFYLMHKKKLIKKYFGDKLNYNEIVNLTKKVSDDLSIEDKNKIELLEKYKAEMSKISDQLPLTDDEYAELEIPLSKLIQINNFDLPPGLALTLVSANIFVPKILDLKFD